MNCSQARRDLHERIDGSLGAEALADLEDHLARCGPCRAAQAGLESSLAALRGASRLRTPVSFEDQVLDRVRAERAFARRLLPLHAAAVALAALAGTWLAMPRSRPEPAPADVSLAAPVQTITRPLVEASPAPSEPRAAVSPAAREEAPAAPRIDWEGAGREGIRFVAAAADLLASLARVAPAERAAPEPLSVLPAAVDALPAVPDEPPATVARPAEGPPEAPGRPAHVGRAVIVRQGNETVLFSSGPPEKEIPALLALLRDQGGEGADLALARLALLARDLASRGIAARESAPGDPSLLERLDSIFSRAPEGDERVRVVGNWERWWGTNQPAICRAGRADPGVPEP